MFYFMSDLFDLCLGFGAACPIGLATQQTKPKTGDVQGFGPACENRLTSVSKITRIHADRITPQLWQDPQKIDTNPTKDTITS